ncbi:MAG: LPS-assembly protein LptD [bacterium ADurb.Bin374]|nr:MAG: LPS-assembly protein LptD [bacterium ADurb.Bin374]
MQRLIAILSIVLLTGLPAHSAEEGFVVKRKNLRPIATEPFSIPDTPPNMTITSAAMQFASGVVVLEGNVRAVRDPDLLTCGRARLYQTPRRIHATHVPRLFRKESLPEKRSTREMTLDATDIVWNDDAGTINASSGVAVKLEERTWDMATYSWVIISADAMEGDRGTRRLRFDGNVKVKDREHFAQGRHLDYDRASSTAILAGDAMVETEEWSPKEQRMVKRTLTGQIIRYNTETKAASSE